ncbi:MAG: class I SAM-dependent methyltransferase [Pseudomonadota bacterium]
MARSRPKFPQRKRADAQRRSSPGKTAPGTVQKSGKERAAAPRSKPVPTAEQPRRSIPKATSTKADSATTDAKKAQQRDDLLRRVQRSGARLPETVGLIFETPADENYALIDTGDGEKLERYGPLVIRRPEGQAVWQPTLSKEHWDKADAIFTGDTDEEGQGRWRYPKRAAVSASKADAMLPETWRLAFDGLPYFGRFTSFRHTGVFPEQATHWRNLRRSIEKAQRASGPVRVLNLFGYTGLASLVAAAAGADVTHVDASKKAIGWARENQTLAGLDDKPIRWICEDAMRFCAREVRRGNSYDIILLDPPAFGRGAKGEVWQLFTHLPYLLDLIRALQSPQPIETVLTAYAIRASHLALHELMQEAFCGLEGRLESGELVLRQEAGGRLLSTSMFSRFIGPGAQTEEHPRS